MDVLEVAQRLANHVLAMKDDAYLCGHPEWEEIVVDAVKLDLQLMDHE